MAESRGMRSTWRTGVVRGSDTKGEANPAARRDRTQGTGVGADAAKTMGPYGDYFPGTHIIPRGPLIKPY